jgi:GTP 3',8-cyclase
MSLQDASGRTISDLRVSVTDRCNLRCQYCMPADGMPWLEREEILDFEEIERLVALLVDLGIEDVRLTGGEPLARRDLPLLVGRLSAIEGIRDLSLTTNGVMLAAQAEALAAAGLGRVNVSLDSLLRERFAEVTRRDLLDRVLEGLDAVAAHPEIGPVKINAVPLPGFSAEDARRFCALARRRGFQVRFIEFMPLDGDRAWAPDRVLSGAEVRAMIEAEHPLRELPREPHATARVYAFADGRGEVGFVNPLSEPFCSDCNRLRLTADGRLRTCLFSRHETDLRGPLRRGASDAELERIVRAAVWRKELKHRVNEPGFRPPARTMSAIGG